MVALPRSMPSWCMNTMPNEDPPTAEGVIAEVNSRSVRWWFDAFAATALTWSSRYLVVNALFWGFVPGADQLVVFGRQFVVWVVLMVSPTPGGSGVSEWLFTEYYGDLLHNTSMMPRQNQTAYHTVLQPRLSDKRRQKTTRQEKV